MARTDPPIEACLQNTLFNRGDWEGALEEWKALLDPAGYSVSTFGRLKSPVGRIAKKPSDGRYHRLEVGGRRFVVHRLLWEAFYGEIEGDLEINHINGKKNDNRLENLEMVTAQENILHAFRIGLKSHRGENHPASILTEAAVLEIRNSRAVGVDLLSLATKYGVTRQIVSMVARGVAWPHVGGPITNSGRGTSGARNGAAKLSEGAVERIRCARHAGRTLQDIATEHGVAPQTISKICLGRARRFG